MTQNRSAVVTVAFGHSTEHLDYTFLSFAERNPGLALHAFILGDKLPQQQLPQIQYHLTPTVPDFSHPLREVYFRRMALIDELDVDYAVVVDSYDVLCLQTLPPLDELLGNCAVAGCVEHMGGRYVMGQGYTSNFLNCGVMFWNLTASREIRREIVARGKSRFRLPADDQYAVNEILQTKYYDRLRILPCQFNYRSYFLKKQQGWPTVEHLDGVLIYHNAVCMDEAKRLAPVRPKAVLPELEPDGRPLTPREQFWRRARQRFVPWVVK